LRGFIHTGACPAVALANEYGNVLTPALKMWRFHKKPVLLSFESNAPFRKLHGVRIRVNDALL
jgi:hypothetical protein